MADDETDGLVEKNRELLGEVKKLKARVKELEDDLGAEKGRADTAEAEVKRITLDGPVEAVLGDLFAVKLKYVLPDVKEHFDFVPGDDGAVRFVTAEGEPVEITDRDGKREAQFTARDVRTALEAHGGFDEVLKAAGSGGSGKPPGSSGNGTIQPPSNDGTKVEPRFGLR